MNQVICPNCGAKMKEWWHTLSPGLVSALVKFSKSIKAKGVNEAHLQSEVKFTKNEYNNFQKLRFHALVAKSGKSGYWILTKRGVNFLKNRISIPKKVKTYRNRVVGHSEELVHFQEFAGVLATYEKEFDFDIHDGKLF